MARAHEPTDDELAERSRLPLYVSSDDDDVCSIASEAQLARIEHLRRDRVGNDNRVCKTRPRTEAMLDMTPAMRHRIDAWVRAGRDAFRASQIDETRVRLRRTSGVLEVIPGWFVPVDRIRSWADCIRVVRYLSEQHGGKWSGTLDAYCARHPLPCVRSSPMLQNMRVRDFMHVALLHALLRNGATAEDRRTCIAAVTDKFRPCIESWMATAFSAAS